MSNAIRDIMEKRGLKPTTFAREIGIPSSTMFSIYRGQVEIGRISVENFIRIAHGLGMSVEELYYGKPPERVYLDPRQVSLNGHFESFNEAGKDELSRMADRMSHDPSIRIEKDRQEDDRIQTAMGA